MKQPQEIVDEFAQSILWVENVKTLDQAHFLQPIADEKWSCAQIVAHIMLWDEYVANEILPQMKQDADVRSKSIQEVNDIATDYGHSGITAEELIKQTMECRKKLIASLRRKPDPAFFETFTLDGEAIDEYSGQPHTLYGYLCSFIWHDGHHKQQVESFLSSEMGMQSF
ncbi:DinB family protein [Bacillus testis]|uniref:DinB family protein n=1 Tax=Bacillus testis TaxID=1622072 RepID=UPI00067E6B17|nr:DinB family protein [Bacillus testis]